MRDIDYAYCVARIRAKEADMLKSSDFEKLLSFENADEALRFLRDKKWVSSDFTDIKSCISLSKEQLWKLLSESVPDKSELNALCVLNDFFNIKAAVKCLITSEKAESFMMTPTTVDIKAVSEKLNTRDFKKLFGERADTAEKAYLTAVKSENGQSAEIIIDRAALDCMAEYSKNSTDRISGKIYGFICDSTNIKIALRCALSGKDRAFLEEAIGECTLLERSSLIEETLNGKDALFGYLGKSANKEGVSELLKSSSAYDKWCEERIALLSSESKFTAFTFAPVCSYYYRKMSEIRKVSVILTSLSIGADKETIRERIGSTDA